MNNKKIGNLSTGHKSTGHYSTGDYSTGDKSTGDYSTGDYSIGYYSTGDKSTGNCSTGNCSTGDYSTGNCSTGNCSTGDYSTGNWSTGNWSISNYSTGFFCTKDGMGMSIFNKEITIYEINSIIFPNFLNFKLTEWQDINNIEAEEITKEIQVNKGRLNVYSYKEAFTKACESASKEEIEQLKSLPHFDKEIFFEISGFMVE